MIGKRVQAESNKDLRNVDSLMNCTLHIIRDSGCVAWKTPRELKELKGAESSGQVGLFCPTEKLSSANCQLARLNRPPVAID